MARHHFATTLYRQYAYLNSLDNFPPSVGAWPFTLSRGYGAPRNGPMEHLFGTVGAAYKVQATAAQWNGGFTQRRLHVGHRFVSLSSGYTISNIHGAYARLEDTGGRTHNLTLGEFPVNAPGPVFIDPDAGLLNPTVPKHTDSLIASRSVPATRSTRTPMSRRVQFDWSGPGKLKRFRGYTELASSERHHRDVLILTFNTPGLTHYLLPLTVCRCLGSSVTFQSSFHNRQSNGRFRWKKDGSYIPSATTRTLTLIQSPGCRLVVLTASSVNAWEWAETSASTLTGGG